MWVNLESSEAFKLAPQQASKQVKINVRTKKAYPLFTHFHL